MSIEMVVFSSAFLHGVDPVVLGTGPSAFLNCEVQRQNSEHGLFLVFSLYTKSEP
jgi:hypothetical protein